MTERLKGKAAVVTGGGAGIGRGVALALAEEGAGVVVSDFGRDSDGIYLADKVVEEIKKANGTAVASYDSVATMKGGENIIKTATGSFGRIDILVNCAGFCRSAPSIEITEEDWDSIIAVHLKGHFSCARAAIPEMIKQQSGRIINISSRAGFLFSWGGLGSLPYATAKAGIVGFTALLSAELKQYGITVNAILPSAITKGFPEKRPRFGGGDTEGPEFLPPLFVYLATDEAKNITGQFFYISAGDIVIFNRPMQLEGPHKFIRKMGKWTVDEISEVIPPLMGQG
jgi:NAD(P)-dependent dehydrogenase (short-subunit alcohol dehydrogenase family)